MRFSLPALFLALSAVLPALAQLPAPPETPMSPFKTAKERVSYGIARRVGEGLKADGFEIDVEAFMKGLTEAMKGEKAQQNDAAFVEAVQVYQKEISEKRVADNKAFLEANAKKPGVMTTPSGLQYQVLKAGAGKKPLATDNVKVHYHGTFLDGKVFDSSYEREMPASFPLNGVIKGWTEGVPLMQVGAKYRFWVPSELAYGPRGRDGIPPNSVLSFDIELLDILPPDGPGELPPQK